MTFCEPSIFSVTLIGILNKFLRIPGNPFPYKQTGVEFWHGISIYPSRIGGLHKCDMYYWSNKRIPSSELCTFILPYERDESYTLTLAIENRNPLSL